MKSLNEALRLLFLADQMGYANGTTHGGTTYFVNVLPALHRRGIDLTVCFMKPRHPMAEQLEAAGVSPIFLERRKWDPRAFLDVLKLVRRHRSEVLHLASLKSMLFGRWIARLSGASSVIHVHDMSPIPQVVRLLERVTSPCTDATIVLSEAMRPWTQRTFGIPAERMTVVPNGIDIQPFGCVDAEAGMRIRREMGVDDSTPLVVVVGRVEPAKGQDRMIRAMPGILQKVPRAVLCIVGDGCGREACEELSRELGVADRVRFMGFRRDIPQILAAADLVVVPSLIEAFGYTALEAMAAGRPVVGFRVDGLTEVIDENRTGLLVPPNDKEGLVIAVSRLLINSDVAKRFGDAGRQRAQQFALENHVDLLLDVYAAARRDRRERVRAHGDLHHHSDRRASNWSSGRSAINDREVRAG